MNKLLLSLSLTLCTLSFAQIKKIPISIEEVNVLGRLIQDIPYDNSFTKAEFEKYNIANTLAYYAEYTYAGKVLYREVFKLKNITIKDYVETSVYFDSHPCFKTTDIPMEVSFDLLKDNNWQISKSVIGDNICYKRDFLSSLKIIESKEYKKYNILSLADGKIIINLYRLED